MKLVALAVLLIIGILGYNHFFKKDYSKPWWTGAQTRNICVVNNPGNRACGSTLVTAEDGRITKIDFSDGSSASISISDCGKAETEYGLAGKDKRYCVVEELGGGRKWQINE